MRMRLGEVTTNLSKIGKSWNSVQTIRRLFSRPHLIDFPYHIRENPLSKKRVYLSHQQESESKVIEFTCCQKPTKRSFLRTAFYASKAKSVLTLTTAKNLQQSQSLLPSSTRVLSDKNVAGSVLLIYVDGLSPFLLLPDSSGRSIMKFISSLFREGYIFENFFSSGEWTLPNLASMFYGQLPSAHGLHLPDYKIKERYISPKTSSIFQHLSRLQVAVKVFSANPYMNPNYGFHLGVQEFYYKKNATAREILALFKNYSQNSSNSGHKSKCDALFLMDIHHDLGESYGKRSEPSADQIQYVTSQTRLHSIDAKKLLERAESLDILFEKELSENILQKYESIVLISDHGSARLRSEIELCLDDARTRTTFAVSNKNHFSIYPDSFVGMNSVPSLLNTLFNSEPFPSEWNYFDELVFSESIYPKLPYRLKIRSSSNTWDFVSHFFWTNKNTFKHELEQFLSQESLQRYSNELGKFRRGVVA